MSLKQRAVQCSAYIPASQYVPVYSRPHRGRVYEELSPITPKPSFDDPYCSRTQSIHEAVKQWLDSSPKSVIGPLYRSRSPSSGSPPSHGSPMGLPIAPASRLSFDRHDSARLNTNDNRAHDEGTTPLASMQKSEDKSGDGSEAIGSIAVPQSDREKSCARDEEPSAREEATNDAGTDARGNKRPIEDFNPVDENQFAGSSEPSSRDTSSREFDAVLAAAVIASEASEEVESIQTSTIIPAHQGGPQVHLKPPRGLEKTVLGEEGQKSADLSTDTTREASSRFVGGAKANTAEKCSAEIPSVEETRFCDGASSNQAVELPVASPVMVRRISGDRSSLWKTDELIRPAVGCALGSKRRSGSTPPAGKSGLRNESFASADSARFKAGDLSNRTASFASSYDSRADPSRRRTQLSYNSGDFTANAANHVSPQHMYELPHHSTGREKLHRLMRQTATTPEEWHQPSNSKSNQQHVSPTKGVLENAKRNKQQEKVAAWEASRNAAFFDRYKLEESRIRVWEEQKISKASMALTKLELDLEKKRARATEKMHHEVATTQKKAEQMKANAEAKRAEKAAKAAVRAQILLAVGKSPLSCFCI